MPGPAGVIGLDDWPSPSLKYLQHWDNQTAGAAALTAEERELTLAEMPAEEKAAVIVAMSSVATSDGNDLAADAAAAGLSSAGCDAAPSIPPMQMSIDPAPPNSKPESVHLSFAADPLKYLRRLWSHSTL